MGVYTVRQITEEKEPIQNWIEIDKKKMSIHGSLTVFEIRDHNYFIWYAPALNLSGYGETPDEAKLMLLDVVIDDYYETLIKLPKAALFEELSQYGWIAADRNSEIFENTAHVDKDGILRNFDLPEDTEINERVLTMA